VKYLKCVSEELNVLHLHNYAHGTLSHRHRRTHTHTHIDVYIHTNTRTHVHTHAHTHTHTHTKMCSTSFQAGKFEFASYYLRGDKQVVMTAAGEDGAVLQYAGKKLRGDETWGAGVDILTVNTHSSIFTFEPIFWLDLYQINYRYHGPIKWD